MSEVFLEIDDRVLPATRAVGHEALDGVGSVTVDLELDAPLGAIVGRAAAVQLVTAFEDHRFLGVVTKMTTPARRTRGSRASVVVTSSLHRLALTKRSRVVQHLPAPMIVKTVLEEHGLAVRLALGEEHAPREYVVQYAESDLDFVRRLLEDHGLHLRREVEVDVETLTITDTSSAAPLAIDRLRVGEPAGLTGVEPLAWDLRATRRRRAGRVTLRDHDLEHPALALEGGARANVAEATIEVYAAPGRFKTPAEGRARADLALEALRADATVYEFAASTASLVPGYATRLDADTPELGPSESIFITSRTWSFDRRRDLELRVRAIPLDVPFRLARITKPARIDGVHRAIVTGAAGEEIHPDELGRVRVRFFWDREGPNDDRSSLPVRVVQPNLPGSMAIPRVGWEVLVAFEDGDPERPFVLGRVYNELQKPPFGLPGNKTITSLGTFSSPGGAKENRIHFDDAAGRQHFSVHAGSGKTTSVGANQKWATLGDELWGVKGAQTIHVGGSDTLTVKGTHAFGAASQSESVAGDYDVTVGTAQQTKTGSESISVAAMLHEKVGNPADGLRALAEAVSLHGVGAALGAGAEAIGGAPAHIAAALLTSAAGAAVAAGEAEHAGQGSDGVKRALEKSGVDAVSGLLNIPGLDAVTAAAEGTGKTPWAPNPNEDDDSKAKGGASAAVAAPGAAGAPGGAGQRVIKASGMKEIIGATSASIAPASIRWTTAGGQLIAIGGSHNVKAVKVHTRVAGAQVDEAPKLSINAAATIARAAKGALTRVVDGAASYKAGGQVVISSEGAVSLTVAGTLSLTGSNVTFKVGGSSVAIAPGGLLVKASSVSFESAFETSGKEVAP